MSAKLLAVITSICCLGLFSTPLSALKILNDTSDKEKATLLTPLTNVPIFMREVVVNEGKAATREEVALGDVKALSNELVSISDTTLKTYKAHVRERIPLIMALFTDNGERFILYRPKKEPLEAKPLPQVYELTKSILNAARATYEIVAPYLIDPAADQSWRGPMLAYRTRTQTALTALNSLQLKPDDRALFQSVLNKALDFMSACLDKNGFNYTDVESYARGMRLEIDQLIQLEANIQVGHWMKVVSDWRDLLGKDWERTYAITSTPTTARENNPLFTILAQFMGERAINDKLLLIETQSTATPEEMLTVFARIVSDRARARVFFSSSYTTGSDLLGITVRGVIEKQLASQNKKANLPPLAPPNNHFWPWRVGPQLSPKQVPPETKK
jgi:hypothetical protein